MTLSLSVPQLLLKLGSSFCTLTSMDIFRPLIHNRELVLWIFSCVALVIDSLFLSAKRLFFIISRCHTHSKGMTLHFELSKRSACLHCYNLVPCEQGFLSASPMCRISKAPYWFISCESIVGFPCSINTPSSLFKQLCNQQQTPTAVGEHSWIVRACTRLLF